MISGVPQGSVLGPLLFLVYINDLDCHVSASSLSLFADDSQCLRTIHDISDCHHLQSDLDSMVDWSTSWKVYTSLPKLSTTSHFYFYQIVWLWNSLPPLDLDLSFPSLKHAVYNLYWNYFISHFDISLSCSWYHVCPSTNCYSIPISSSI